LSGDPVKGTTWVGYANVKQSRKGLLGRNILSYLTIAVITQKKSFIKLVPGREAGFGEVECSQTPATRLIH